jgi:hypothetical protein
MPRTHYAGVPEKDLVAMINGYLSDVCKEEPIPYTPEEVNGPLKDMMKMASKSHGDPFSGKVMNPPLFVPEFAPAPVPAHLVLPSQRDAKVGEKEGSSNSSAVGSSVSMDISAASSSGNSPVNQSTERTRLPQATAITEMLHDTAASFPRSEMEKLGRFHKLNLTFAPDTQAPSETMDEDKAKGFDPDAFGETDPEVARKSMEDKFAKWLSKQRDGKELTNPHWFGTGESPSSKAAGKATGSSNKSIADGPASSSKSAEDGSKTSANASKSDEDVSKLASNVSTSLTITAKSNADADKQALVSNDDDDFHRTDMWAGAPVTAANNGKGGKGKGKEAVKDSSRAAQIAKGKEALSTPSLSNAQRRALVLKNKKKHRKPLPPPSNRELTHSKPEPEPEPEPESEPASTITRMSSGPLGHTITKIGDLIFIQWPEKSSDLGDQAGLQNDEEFRKLAEAKEMYDMALQLKEQSEPQEEINGFEDHNRFEDVTDDVTDDEMKE